jgi:uncharacterized membrane protein
MLSFSERHRIRRAVRRAEAGTTGRIAVRVVPDAEVDAFERAKSEFERAGMHRAADRNASMILVAPHARQFAVFGDAALHERVDAKFWNDVVAQVQPALAGGDLVGGIERAVASIGEQLHAHFAKAVVG